MNQSPMNDSSPARVFLLDGMALIYRAHFALIRSPIFNSKGTNTSAIFGFTNVLLEIETQYSPTHIALVLDTSAELGGEVHTLAPHQMIPVWSHEAGERECYAVWVETEGLGVRLLYWRDGEPPILPYPDSCCEVGQGVVELIPVNDGWSLELLGNTWLVHDPSAT